MFYSFHHLDQDTLTSQLTALIESERDLREPRHVDLTRMINELSVTGFPLLVETARALLDEDRGKTETWMSAPLRSALERACSGVEGEPPKLECRYDASEETHLLNQLRALLVDLELLLTVSDESEISRLRTSLWIGATRHLLKRVDEELDQDLRLRLIYASDELGLLAFAPDRFEQGASRVLAEHLRLCHAGGGVLSLILPGESDEAQIAQLRESGLALDLRGVERFKLEGYNVLGWLDGVERGLDEVQTIEARMLSDDDVEGLQSRGLLERVEEGWSAPVMVDEVAGVEFLMVRCPAGEFWMGNDDGGHEDEMPRHRVSITKPFLINHTPVTQAQWSAVMSSYESNFQWVNRLSDPEWKFIPEGDNCPAEHVSWFHCVLFCNVLSDLAGLEPIYDIDINTVTVHLHLDRTGYRLPTEAEWEYMAKAGTDLTYAGSNDIDEVAWHNGETEPVGQKKPNAWGIYDCSGCADEWCSDEWNGKAYQGRISTIRDPHENSDEDVYLSVSNFGSIKTDSERVFRGTSHVAGRLYENAGCDYFCIGFRVLRCEP